MEAEVQLALMAKATAVFGNADTFLSFPITPLSYAKDELDFAQLRNVEDLIDFSTVADMIPRGVYWDPVSGASLSESYAKVLSDLDLAQSSRTPAEEEEYQLARSVLFTEDANGARFPTEAATQYRSHRDKCILLEQEYLAQKLSMTVSTDEAERIRWENIVEPQLRNALNEAFTSWESSGFRREIETAEARMKLLGSKSPHAFWKECSDRFISSIDTLTSASDLRVVYPTTFTPENALDDASWRQFTLSGIEIVSAVNAAPANLRENMNANSISEIASISFEFSSAKLVRPWFSIDLLKSRFWRFPDGVEALSDGEEPARGTCTAYTAGLIFARNIVVNKKPSSGGGGGTSGGRRFDFAFDKSLLLKSSLLKELQPRRVDLNLHARSFDVSSDTIVTHDTVRRIRRREHASDIRRNDDREIRIREHTVPREELRVLRNARAIDILRASTFNRDLETRDTGGGGPAAPADPGVATLEKPIFVLAFISKPLPRCPNPDPDLQW